jgi:hypothetical protein
LEFETRDDVVVEICEGMSCIDDGRKNEHIMRERKRA